MSSSKRAATLDLVNLAYIVRDGSEREQQAKGGGDVERRQKEDREGGIKGSLH